MSQGPVQRTVVGGVPVDVRDNAQWVDLLVEDWRAKKTGAATKIVTTANGQSVSLFGGDAAFRKVLLACDHVAADGMSVVTASRRYTKAPLPERVPTTDWFHDAARAASEHGIKFFLLGAAPEANARAVERVKALYPQLQLVGSRDGYFTPADIPQIAAEVEATGADVLWLGVGFPKQVYLAHELKPLLPSVTWIRTCGGLFDFLSGDRTRAPELMQKLGLEWAYRTMLEPRRLLWRYLTTNVHASWLYATRSGRPLHD